MAGTYLGHAMGHIEAIAGFYLSANPERRPVYDPGQFYHDQRQARARLAVAEVWARRYGSSPLVQDYINRMRALVGGLDALQPGSPAPYDEWDQQRTAC